MTAVSASETLAFVALSNRLDFAQLLDQRHRLLQVHTALPALSCAAKANSKTVEVKKLASSVDVTDLLNRAREDYKLLDVFFASHGVVGAIDLSYSGRKSVKITSGAVPSISASAFALHGRLYSYACRTGVSVEDHKVGFKTEADAKPENSLAQKMADHFGIEVHAFLRRSFYGNVLRDPSMSENIVKALSAGRKVSGDNAVIDIPPEHEGLPHSGLADGWILRGPKREGTDNYALWRKLGGCTLPTAAESPAGLGADMRVFKPRSK